MTCLLSHGCDPDSRPNSVHLFLQQGSELPAALVLGQASCSVTISGSHVDPTIAGSWEAPAAQVPCVLGSLTGLKCPSVVIA
jgi:hypothetical protein